MSFKLIIAEPPYDQMGLEFAELFGHWCDTTKLHKDMTVLSLSTELFKKRLDLATKFQTFFATQVTEKGSIDVLWKERVNGIGNRPAYSFATPHIPRTVRFYNWCLMVTEEPNSIRYWDTNYAPFPNLPAKVEPYTPMNVWAHRYEPRFNARYGGAFECRRLLYGSEMYLIEHPRSRWIRDIFHECETFWNISFDEKNSKTARVIALASFEWLWFWANPFMRSGALTGDALSLVMQKHIGVKTREAFYHQDCEALLMNFDEYVNKRTVDMLYGFRQKFPM